jgi:hypothetical protein
MNSKTVKLLKKFSTAKKVAYADTKRMWENAKKSERHGLRLAIESQLTGVPNGKYQLVDEREATSVAPA